MLLQSRNFYILILRMRTLNKRNNNLSKVTQFISDRVPRQSVVGRIMYEFPEPEYVTLYNDKDLVHMIKLRIQDGKIILDHLGGPTVITRVLIRKEGEAGRCEEEDVIEEAEVLWCYLLPLNMQGGHEPRKEGSI